MELGRRRRQLPDDGLVQIERHLRQYRHRLTDTLGERLNVPGQDRVIDVDERRLGRKSHVEHGEERDETRIDIVASATRLTHRRHVVDVLDRLPVEVLTTVVASAAVYQQLQHGYGLLGAVRVDRWHVHVVDEDHQSSTERRPVHVLGPLLHARLQVPLDVQRVRAAGEVDLEQLEFLAIQRVQEVGGRRRFAGAAFSDQQYLQAAPSRTETK